MPPRQRSAVVLRFLGDLAHREIAAAIGCSEEAARRSLHEGLRKPNGGGRMNSRTEDAVSRALRAGPAPRGPKPPPRRPPQSGC